MAMQLDHRLFLEQDYAIVNPMQVDGSVLEAIPSIVVGERRFACERDQLPRLVVLGDLTREDRFALLDTADALLADSGVPLFSALVRSDESARTFAALAGDNLLLRHPLRGAFYFRFFDPRVFVHLARLLSAAQLSRIVAPARSWLWFDPWAVRWREFVASVCGAEADAGPSALDDRQWDALSRIEVVNRALLQWQSEARGEPTPSVVEAIDASVREAVDGLGLTETDDLVAYALNERRHGSGFHDTRAAREALERVRRREASYAAATRELAEPATAAG